MPPQILTKNDPAPVDLSDGDIQWQIVAEWLQTVQWSQSGAYRKPPLLFGMVPLLRPYNLTFSQNGVQNAPPGPTSQRMLQPGKYDGRYRQDIMS